MVVGACQADAVEERDLVQAGRGGAESWQPAHDR